MNTDDSSFDELVERVELARSIIDAKLPKPAVIHVASILTDDGSSTLATLLAFSFVRTGQTTLLATVLAPTRIVAPQTGGADIFSSVRQMPLGVPDSIALTAVVASVDKTQKIYSEMRGRYEVSVTSSTFAHPSDVLPLSINADLVVVAVRKGRSITRQDREFTKILKDADVPLHGIVLVDPETIRDLEQLELTPSGLSRDIGVRAKVVGVEVR